MGVRGKPSGESLGPWGEGFPRWFPPLPCWPDRTRFAAVPDLASPDVSGWGGEVRNALEQRPLRVRAGQQGYPRAARVHSACTRDTAGVRELCGRCSFQR